MHLSRFTNMQHQELYRLKCHFMNRLWSLPPSPPGGRLCYRSENSFHSHLHPCGENFGFFFKRLSTITSHLLLLKSYTFELCYFNLRWCYIWPGGPRMYLDLDLFSLIPKHEDLTQRRMLLLAAEPCLWLDKSDMWAGQNQRQNSIWEHLRGHLVLACVISFISVITDIIDMNINNHFDLYEMIASVRILFCCLRVVRSLLFSSLIVAHFRFGAKKKTQQRRRKKDVDNVSSDHDCITCWGELSMNQFRPCVCECVCVFMCVRSDLRQVWSGVTHAVRHSSCHC